MAANRQIQTWQKLVELAEIEMDSAAKTLQMMRQTETQDQEQLDSLKNYVEEYNQAGIDQRQSLSQLNTYRLFAGKLMQAIESQTQKCEQSAAMVDKAQQAWLAKRARHKALSQLLAKFQLDRETKLNKQEQKMLDELAAQQSQNAQN